jgi:hypothetical protein
MKSIICAMLVCVSVWSSQNFAQASEGDWPDGSLEILPLFVVSGIGGIVSGLGNTYCAAKGYRPNTFWRTTNLVMGSLNLVTSGLSFYYIEKGGFSSGIWASIGLAGLAIAAFDFGTYFWGESKPEKTEVSLSPLAIPDSNGSLALGMSLNVMNW